MVVRTLLPERRSDPLENPASQALMWPCFDIVSNHRVKSETFQWFRLQKIRKWSALYQPRLIVMLWSHQHSVVLYICPLPVGSSLSS
jgi:hypothetical protein